MRTTFKTVEFEFANLPGWEIGPPTRGILHTDGNPRPHTALGALQWGDRERAFSIHYYIDGETVYRAIPESFLAFHVKEHRKAAAAGYPTTAPGLSKPRGDVRAIGIEHVMLPDGSWDPETRLTSVLLGAEINSRFPGLEWSEHATWDPWQRPNDVGKGVNLADWIADVRDATQNKPPHRTVAGAGPLVIAQPSATDATAATAAGTITERLTRLEDQMQSVRAAMERIERRLDA